jgi:hypothetical protein
MPTSDRPRSVHTIPDTTGNPQNLYPLRDQTLVQEDRIIQLGDNSRLSRRFPLVADTIAQRYGEDTTRQQGLLVSLV